MDYAANRLPETVSSVSETLETPKKQARITPEMQQAVNWLKANPDMQGLSLRGAAGKVGVSYSTIKRAKELGL